MKASKPRTWVKMFMPRFARKVKAGTKRQTVRPWPKRRQDIPVVGDLVDCRKWEGKPYRSKQVKLRKGELTLVAVVTVAEDRILIGGLTLSFAEADKFARDDGFEDFKDMKLWFLLNHGFPFKGILLSWQ